MNGLILISAALLSAGVTIATNWLALIPWRRSKGKHWSEQARLLHPARLAAACNLWSVPAVLMLGVSLLWPGSSPLWAFTGIVSALGAIAGTLALEHEVFPRIPWPDLLRQAAIGCLLRFSFWFILITAAALMPDEFVQSTWTLGATVLGAWVVWSRGGFIRLGLALGLFAPAPERLREIAADTSIRMNIPFREVLLIRSPLAQAFALIKSRRLLFTNRLLELLPDDEVAGVCAHELAHLAESKSARSFRSLQGLAYLPWLFFNPLIHTYGLTALFGLCAMTMAIPPISRGISRKLESRADDLATANQGESGTYARALTRLYEDGLLPAVNARKQAAHPHLYDRILAAGVTPDFSRPKPAASMSWNGALCASLVGVLIFFLALRQIQSNDGEPLMFFPSQSDSPQPPPR